MYCSYSTATSTKLYLCLHLQRNRVHGRGAHDCSQQKAHSHPQGVRRHHFPGHQWSIGLATQIGQVCVEIRVGVEEGRRGGAFKSNSLLISAMRPFFFVLDFSAAGMNALRGTPFCIASGLTFSRCGEIRNAVAFQYYNLSVKMRRANQFCSVLYNSSLVPIRKTDRFPASVTCAVRRR